MQILLLHLTESKLGEDDFLFDYVHKGKHVCVTHSSFIEQLWAGLRCLGVDPSSYSGHSFRRGGCSLSYQAGLNLTEIKIRGDWHSQANERYLYVSPDDIFESARTK